jgi:hypothetical protein
MNKKDKEGNQIECLVIPIDKNNLVRSTKEGYDNIYFKFVGFPLREPRRNDNGNLTQTHLVRRDTSKEERDNMSQDELNNMPILGNLVNLEGEQTGGADIPNDAGGCQTFDENSDDLPF